VIVAQIILVLLHGPSGGEIMLNPREVVAMHAKVPNEQPNEHFVDGVQCLINTTDSKFVSVVEPCETVRRLLQQAKRDKKP
jgi:hypothetical protein